MTLDLVALGILVFFGVIGAWRGVLASGFGLVSLVLAYTMAAFGAQPLGAALSARFGLPAIAAPMLAGTAVFTATILLCAVVRRVLDLWDRGRRDGAPRSVADRFGGAFFGLLRGALVVLLVSVLAGWLEAARDSGILPSGVPAPELERSRVRDATERILEGVAEKVLASSDAETGPAARMMARMAIRPAGTLHSVQRLLDDERLRELQSDPLFWTLVENGAGERAINQASFHELARDPELRGAFADLGLIGAEGARDSAVFRQSMGEMLSELGPRIKGLRNDPELQRLARDPEIVALLQSGDTLALISHPEIEKIVARVAASR